MAGLNAGFKKANVAITPYTARDVVAVGALLAARFGANGGSEPRRAMFLDALRKRLGETKGKAVFDDLRAADDAESPTIDPGRFAYQLPPAAAPGSVVLDDGQLHAGGALWSGRLRSTAGPPRTRSCSVRSGRRPGGRSSSAVPRSATSSRSSSWRSTCTAAATTSAARCLPGLPLVLIGRGPDFAWTVTSSQGDNIDIFAETLCGDDDRHYLYKGTLPRDGRARRGHPALDRPARRAPEAPPDGARRRPGLRDGRRTRVALAQQRSTRGREVLSARALFALNTGAVTSAASFTKAVGQVEPMFNLFYADDRDIAHVTAGRLPIRAPGTDPALPTVGTGEYDWRGFLGAKAHPQTVNPASGAILDWNSKPAARLGRADGNWSYGSVQRKDC